MVFVGTPFKHSILPKQRFFFDTQFALTYINFLSFAFIILLQIVFRLFTGFIKSEAKR